jgi:hypothetical protein
MYWGLAATDDRARWWRRQAVFGRGGDRPAPAPPRPGRRRLQDLRAPRRLWFDRTPGVPDDESDGRSANPPGWVARPGAVSRGPTRRRSTREEGRDCPIRPDVPRGTRGRALRVLRPDVPRGTVTGGPDEAGVRGTCCGRCAPSTSGAKCGGHWSRAFRALRSIPWLIDVAAMFHVEQSASIVRA